MDHGQQAVTESPEKLFSFGLDLLQTCFLFKDNLMQRRWTSLINCIMNCIERSRCRNDLSDSAHFH